MPKSTIKCRKVIVAKNLNFATNFQIDFNLFKISNVFTDGLNSDTFTYAYMLNILISMSVIFISTLDGKGIFSLS